MFDLPNQGRLLGVDAGDRRVGLAVCDDLQLLATPLLVLNRRSRAEDFKRLVRIAAEQRIVGLVIGHPLNADGSEGLQARRIARYARRLAAALDLPMLLHDEHGSSQTAAERLAQAGKRNSRKPLDAEAAAVILQDYLDAQPHDQP